MYCAALSNTFVGAAGSRAAVGSSEAVLERPAHEQFHWPPDNLKGGPRLGGIHGVDTKDVRMTEASARGGPPPLVVSPPVLFQHCQVVSVLSPEYYKTSS